ncbi:MAG: hypothetical protein SPI91_04580 [Bacilli bacterium]|nr:hypothetical protein [Bacilli bacterium]CCZ59164.1 unknown [Clostridium sp. CAG:710]
MKILIIIFSLFLDFLLSNINYSLLSYFYPMITITTIVYLSNLYTNPNRSNYYLLVFLTSIIYDSIFVGNLLITVSSFMIVAILNMFLKRHLRSNLFNNILMLILSIILYEVFILLLLFVVGYKSFEFSMLLYKITHSLLLNTIYIVIMFLVLKPKKA